MLQEAGVVVVFQRVDRVTHAEGEVCLDLVGGLVRSVLTLRFHVPQHGLGNCLLADHFGNVARNAVFVHETLLGEGLVLLLDEQYETDAGVDDRLAVQGVHVEMMGNVDIGEDLKVRLPMNARTGALFLSVQLTLAQLGDGLAFLKADLSFELAVVRGDGHVFGAVLGRACAQTVQTQRVFVSGITAVVIVFAACVHFAVD